MVRKVVISITSHDQGWSDDRRFHGTYEASWTWFEAEVKVLGGEEGRCAKWRRRLCCNLHAEGRDRTHVVEWRWDGDEEEDRDLVRSLGPGCVLSVVPWARFPGWENHVSCARIDIYRAEVRRL